MNWFKFYGQDFLTDPKMKSLCSIHQLGWVYLLCLASQNNGVIKHITTERLSIMMGILPQDDGWEIMQELFDKLVSLETVTYRNETVTLLRYGARQSVNLSNAERQKKWRENQKIASTSVTQSNVTQRYDSNARIDKIRIDNIPVSSDEKRDPSTKKKKPGGPKCPNITEGHGGCIQFIDSLAASRGVKFTNYPKQINGLHKMLGAGYDFDAINNQIDFMEADRFWKTAGFDLMNVCNEIAKGGRKNG